MFDAEPRNPAGHRARSAEERPVQRLGRARREDDAPPARQQRRHLIARNLDGRRRRAPGLVRARGVRKAVAVIAKPAQHRLARFRRKRGRGLIVEVDHLRHLPANRVGVERRSLFLVG